MHHICIEVEDINVAVADLKVQFAIVWAIALDKTIVNVFRPKV